MDREAQRLEVAAALRRLEAALARLTEAFTHQAVQASVDVVRAHSSAVERICAAYSAIDYGMDDAANESVVCLGVVGVSAAVLHRAEAVNEAKEALKAVCAPLQHVKQREPVKGEPGKSKAIAVIRILLRSIQRSDLNLLATYRKIPILGATPKRIVYTRARTRAVYRKSVAEIDTMLLTMEGPAVSADRARLQALSPKDSPSALVAVRSSPLAWAVAWSNATSVRGTPSSTVTTSASLKPRSFNLATSSA